MPQDVTSDYDAQDKGDWGISWFEVLTSVYLSTGWECPIRTGGTGAKTTYLAYDHPDALLLPDAKRADTSPSDCVIILEYDLLPNFSTSKCYSMSRLGLKTPVAVMPCRPKIPKQKEALDYVWSYYQRLNGSLALKRPLVVKNLEISIVFPHLHRRLHMRDGS